MTDNHHYLGELNTLRQKHFVISATNGADGLAMLDKITPPSLIIVATDMPIMNGPEFIAHLGKNSKFAAIPIAHIASPSEQPLTNTCHSIVKPIDRDTVIQVVAKSL